MADILIYRMRMPTDRPLRLVLNPNGQLFVDHGATFTEYETVELPPHGDLISKDDTMNAILGEPTDAHYPSWYASIVNEMPAIVPANKEETHEQSN